MTVQFDRVVEIQVDTIKIGDLDASFRVVKTLKKEPNTCELTIFNLNAEHRDQLQQAANPRAEISAGYRGRSTALSSVDDLLGGAGSGVGVVYSGDTRDVSSSFEPPDWVTTLESGDGEQATQLARINKSFAAGTSLQTALGEAAKAMGVGLGNSARQALTGELVGGGSEFLNSLTLSGQASKELDRLVKSSGMEWSIQDNVLQLLQAGASLVDSSVVLSGTTGVVGSPTIGNDGVLRVRALMNSDIVPGRQLELDTRTVEGRFRAERCEYIGSTFQRDFYVDVEATEL